MEVSGVSVPPRVLTLVALAIQGIVESGEFRRTRGKKREVPTPTVFHGSRAPPVSIQYYIERIYRYTRCSPSCFVVAFVYIQRYQKRTGALVTQLNVHRLLITSVMLATKFMENECHSNAHYAKIGGVSTKEMNGLELKFLFDLDFRLNVSKEMFEKQSMQLEAGLRQPVERPIHGGSEPREEKPHSKLQTRSSRGTSSACQTM